MTAIQPRTTCRVCGSTDLTELFSLGDQCVSDFLLPAEVGVKEVRCPITLDLCRDCTLVQQRYTAPQDFLYTRHYWYRSGTTATMRDALADVVEDAVGRVELQSGDVVLDIGANDGTLLSFLNGRELVRVGVEPAQNLWTELRQRCEVMIDDFWSARAFGDGMKRWNWGGGPDVMRALSPKIVTALGMFYDLEDPNAFIADVAKVLHPDGVFIAQLMCLKQTVEQRDVGNFAHEHLEFYSLESLETLFGKHGLTIRDISENSVNGGSYRLIVRHKTYPVTAAEYSRVTAAFRKESEIRLHDPATYTSFFQEMVRNRDDCVAYLQSQAVLGKQIWFYGASTKGNVIAQWYGLTPEMGIAAAVDKSTEKEGRVMVGTNVPIFSEGIMREDRPDVCVVLPYAFLDEFIERERDEEWRKRGGKFVVPLPQFKVL